MKGGEPWLRAAAQEAAGADTAGVVAYIRTGRAEAQAQDDRTGVERLAEESSVKEVRDAAETALGGDAATVSAFLHEGQYTAGKEAFRVAVAQAADGGGPDVEDKARQALSTGTVDAYRTFLTKTLAEAQVEDDRVTAAQLVDSGTPEVQSAARIALEGPADLLHRFVESGQYTAKRKDLLSLTHQLQIQQLVSEAAQVAAKAQQDAAKATATALVAANAADKAAEWAAKAKQSETDAAGFAADADQFAKDAEASAAQAAQSAKTARAAADRADTAAHNAAVSASDATVSAELAQASASSAWASASEAQSSAERAGKSAAEAATAAVEAFTTAVAKQREEEEARRKAAVAAKEKAEAGGSTPAELYRCGILGCEALENPGRWCQHNEAYCDVLSRGPAFEASMKQLNDIINEITGLTQLENCARKGDLWACWQLARDATMSAKFRALSTAYVALTSLQRGCTQCFLAGTRVLTAGGGTTPIEKIQAGDLVRATDPVTGETAARRVTRHIVTHDDKYLTALTIRGPTGGRSDLSATYEHPFWSISLRAWVPAEDLRPGDTLRTDTGASATVLANRPYTREATTYSLTVEGLHTFYVLAGDTPLLVHNSECKVLVLAFETYMDEEVKSVDNGYHLMHDDLKVEIAKLPGGIPYTEWMNRVDGAMRENQKIAVSLRGWDPPGGTYQQKFDAAVTKGQGSNWGATEWEMGRLEYHYRIGDLDWDNVSFWDNGKKIPKEQILPPLRPGKTRS